MELGLLASSPTCFLKIDIVFTLQQSYGNAKRSEIITNGSTVSPAASLSTPSLLKSAHWLTCVFPILDLSPTHY